VAEFDEAKDCILKADIYKEFEVNDHDPISRGSFGSVYSGMKINGDGHGCTDGQVRKKKPPKHSHETPKDCRV
jgi:hypothetical protein